MLRLLNTVQRLQHLSAVPFEEAGLSRTEALTLMRACGSSVVAEGPEVPPGAHMPLQASELVRDLGVSAAAISQVVGGLESRGLIRRVPSDKDRRVTEILPTAQGRALADTVKQTYARLGDQLFNRMTDEEQRYFSSILDKANAIVTEESNRLGLPRRRIRRKCTDRGPASRKNACAAPIPDNPRAEGGPDSA